MANTRRESIAEAEGALQAYERSNRAFDDAVARALRLNPTDLRALDWLAEGPRSAGELRDGTGLSSAATTTLIDRLEGRGFVERVGDPADRRRVVVRLTRAGADRITRYYGPIVTDGQSLFSKFSPGEIDGRVVLTGTYSVGKVEGQGQEAVINWSVIGNAPIFNWGPGVVSPLGRDKASAEASSLGHLKSDPR